ncbi:MAG: hypothetical protein F6K03_07935, partial [Kamptonema sp. SIO4C4]|nr:hypothetical protein [Kamptonema sp. SIO4C4]
MKAKEVLRRYAEGERDFRGQSLLGESFQGENLAGADFSYTDIRGTNFSSTNLTEATFYGAKAGLPPSQVVILLVALFFTTVGVNLGFGLLGLVAIAIFQFINIKTYLLIGLII